MFLKRVIRKIIMWALSEEDSSIPLWDDIDFMGTYRAKNLPSPQSDSDAIRKSDLDAHRLASPIDHPDRSITRLKLEYPTENVSLAYLSAINMLVDYVPPGGARNSAEFIITRDWFTDKAVLSTVRGYYGGLIFLRWVDVNTWYEVFQIISAGSADHQLRKYVNRTLTIIAFESVDLAGYRHYYLCSASGSTIKSYRDQLGSANITATDTSISSGAFGVGDASAGFNDRPADLLSYLKPPSSSIPGAKMILEMNIAGSGKPDDPYRPSLAQKTVGIDKLSGVDDWLKLEFKKYKMLRNKGFTDEEIQLLLGYIPKHKVDMLSITWGAYEFMPDKSSSAVIVVYSGNPYNPKALKAQIDNAVSAFKPPKNYSEAVKQYKQLMHDHPEWLAGKDNYAYHVLGHEALESLAVADFYSGFLIDHKTEPQHSYIKKVSDEELRRTINSWIKKMDKHKHILHPQEYEKHRAKLDKILRNGW